MTRQMSQSTNVLTALRASAAFSADECRAVLERNCFGHLSFVSDANVEAVPILFAFTAGWLYFRANAAMRNAIGHDGRVLISVVEIRDATHFASVVARGACCETEATDFRVGDAAASRGMMRLRDRASTVATRARWAERTSIVFRIRVNELRGSTTFVACSAGEPRTLASAAVQPRSQAESVRDDARADDDGMREPRSDRASSSPVLTAAL